MRVKCFLEKVGRALKNVIHPEIPARALGPNPAAHRGAAGGERAVRQRAAGGDAAGAIPHLDASGVADGLRPAVFAARGQADVLPAEPGGGCRGERIHSTGHSRGAGAGGACERPDQSEAGAPPAAGTGAGVFQPGGGAL